MAKPVEQLEQVIIRFAGDSGDGMQLTGGRFTSETALFGNDLSTLPDFPAEIRAPAGSLPGVSGFQIHFADHDILTPGDAPHVLVAMNPAALRTNLKDLPAGRDADRQQRRVQRPEPPEGRLHREPARGRLARRVPRARGAADVAHARGGEGSGRLEARGGALEEHVRARAHVVALHAADRGHDRLPREEVREAAGDRRGEHARVQGRLRVRRDEPRASRPSTRWRPAKLPPGTYRNITGNQALALGLVAASVQSKLPLFLSAYPITPASDILHDLARHKNFGIRTFQAEDEIAAAGAALGASFGGALGVCTSSGPGVILKMETIGLAVTLELPLLILDIQRAGPSTGMPTKPEQADLLAVMFGRNAESPVPVVAASTPGGCFEAAIEAARIALKYRTPVFLLSDAYLANGSEPWLLPDVESLPDISIEFAEQPNVDGSFMPYQRDPETLARQWAIPGTPGLEHRIGGLEKEDVTGNVSYDPDNHDHMVRLRAQKVAGIAADIPELEVDDPDGASLLVLGWGGTYGPIQSAARRLRKEGKKVAHAHLTHLNPFPRNLGDVLGRYDRVLVPEMNLGQLLKLVRAEFLVDAVGYNRVRGMPFRSDELAEAIEAML